MTSACLFALPWPCSEDWSCLPERVVVLVGAGVENVESGLSTVDWSCAAENTTAVCTCRVSNRRRLPINKGSPLFGEMCVRVRVCVSE